MHPITGVVQHYAGAIRSSSPSCSDGPATGHRGPSCGSARIHRGCRGSPTAATWRWRPERCPTCSRSSLPPSRSRCRRTRAPSRPRSGYQAGRYPDPYPKPELLCALTEFEAFCGVRPVDETVALLDELGLRRFAATFEAGRCRRHDRRPAAAQGRHRTDRRGLSRQRPSRGVLGDGPGRALPRRPQRRRHALAQPRPARSRARRSSSPPATCTATSAAPGIELMGASDNVVRAGLTTKAGRRRHRARRDGPDAAARSGDVGGPRLPARRHVDPPAAPRRSGGASRQDARARHRRAGPRRLPRSRRAPRHRRRARPPTSPRRDDAHSASGDGLADLDDLRRRRDWRRRPGRRGAATGRAPLRARPWRCRPWRSPPRRRAR